MTPEQEPDIVEGDLKGFKYFKMLLPLLKRLRRVGTSRDKAGNRQLFFDKYATLVLLYFYNPIIKSMRALIRSADLEKVKRLLGVRRTSLGSFSEATEVFTPEHLRAILQEIAAQAQPLYRGKEAAALKDLCAVDGTILNALPKMAWALWVDDQHRAVKLHLHFDVLRGVPIDATLTPAACSEPAHFQAMLQPGRLYVIDRGYASYDLFRDILAAKSSFIGRVKDNTAFTVKEERLLPTEAVAAGVVRDLVIDKLGQTNIKTSLASHCAWSLFAMPKPTAHGKNFGSSRIGLRFRPNWSVWDIAFVGRSNSSSGGSNACWAADTCCRTTRMASRSRSTRP